MASLLFTIGGAMVNALVFRGTNFVFSRLTNPGEEELKRHDLALEKLQRAREEWSKDQMKRLDFINKRLSEKIEAKAYINNVDVKGIHLVTDHGFTSTMLMEKVFI